MNICLWQNVLNVVTGTTKYVWEFPRVFLRIKVSSGNVWDGRGYYWDWKRNKKDFVIFQLKLVWPNDKDASCVYQLLSYFFRHMNLWHDFLHFIFVSLKSTSFLQILKLVIHSKHSQWLHVEAVVCRCSSNKVLIKFRQISQKTSVLKTLFNKVAGLNFI